MKKNKNLFFALLLTLGLSFSVANTPKVVNADNTKTKVSSLSKVNNDGDYYTWKDKTKVFQYSSGELKDYYAKPIQLTNRTYQIDMFTNVSKSKRSSIFNQSGNDFQLSKNTKVKKSDYLVYITLEATAKNTSNKKVTFTGLVGDENYLTPDGNKVSISTQNLGGDSTIKFNKKQTKNISTTVYLGKAKNYKAAKKLVNKGKYKFTMGATNNTNKSGKISSGAPYYVTVK